MTPEWSHRLVLANVPAGGQSLSLDAPAEARAALARRLGLPAIHALSAELALTPDAGGRIAVRGTLRAELEQECVVTLAPVRASISDPVAWRLLPEGEEPADGDDDPDDIPSEGGAVDLGEELAQQLALALDPYPRAPGAEIPEEHRGDGAHGAFAALAALKPRG